MHFNAKYRTGERFGRLVLLTYLGGRKWDCICDCGNKKIADTSNLLKGHITSCGCFRKERAATLRPTYKVGTYGSSENIAWRNMMTRCYKESSHNWQWSGGRGIKVCESWHNFENFYTDMGDKPEASLTLERVDVNGDYCKENCKWATMKEQQNNRRNTGKNRLAALDYATV